jgi:chromosome segregation ATPase
MNPRWILLAAALTLGPCLTGAPAPSDSSAAQAPKNSDPAGVAAPDAADSSARADKRYDEMLGKMQAAVEEIAQLYGNPVFLQVFTNDVERAAELKERLRVARSEGDIRREIADLEKKRDDLRNEIALKEREAARLSSRLVKQRAALDGVAAAVEQARKAIEETTK